MKVRHHLWVVAVCLASAWGAWTPTEAQAQNGVPSFTEKAIAISASYVHLPADSFAHVGYTAGATIGDFNNDGYMDIFGVTGGGFGFGDMLMLNDGDGTFTYSSAAWGVNIVHNGKGAMAADFDKDGWTDVFVTSAGTAGNVGPGQHILYRNNGNGTFTNVSVDLGLNMSDPLAEDGFGSAFGDYDLDGDLDLFVAGFNGDEGNRLFRQDADHTFTDVTDTIGLWSGTAVAVKGFAPRFVDLDGDRYPELLLAADLGTSRLMRNNGNGTFTDITDVAGVGTDENGMGQAVGDWNGDGLFDWYVTSIYQPIAMWSGNKLYLNGGLLSFSETAATAGVDDGGYGWGAVGVDFDHDGLLDILETNGDAGFGGFSNEQAYLWMNNGDGTFTEEALLYGLSQTGSGRALLAFDLENDGDQDVYFTNNNTVTQFYENDLGGTGIHWLRVGLDTMRNNDLPAHGYGAVVKVTIGGNTQVRGMWGGDNYLGGSEMVAHFGLAGATRVDELRVDWPNGQSTVLTNVAVDQTLTVAAPESTGWHTVGWGVGGTHGTPRLSASGDLLSGNTVTIDLTRAKASATAYLVYGLGEAPVPFKGGTLVPDLNAGGGFLTVATNVQGELSFGGPWPAGVPSGTELALQYWVIDAAAPVGLAGSNAVKNAVP